MLFTAQCTSLPSALFRAIKGSITSIPSEIPHYVRNDILLFIILKGAENERLASLAVEIR